MSSPVLFCLTCARGKQTEPPGSERKRRPSFHSMCFSRCGAGAVGPFCLTFLAWGCHTSRIRLLWCPSPSFLTSPCLWKSSDLKAKIHPALTGTVLPRFKGRASFLVPSSNNKGHRPYLLLPAALCQPCSRRAELHKA